MKYLLIGPEDGEEVCYNLSEVVNIRFDYAKKILNESDMHGNGLKPIEMVTQITFTDGRTATYRTAGREMYFD